VTDIVEASTAEEARTRAERIRAGMRVLAEWQQDVITAYAARDWEALGYTSWDAYLDGEYGEHRVRLPRDQRREIVAGMAQAGMSTRAIGAAIGSSHMTVQRDLDQPSVTDVPDDRPATVKSLDGRERPATRPAPEPNTWIEPQADDDYEDDPEPVTAELVDEPAAHTRTQPPTPQRAPDPSPRVDVSRTVLVALTELRQTRESLQALTVTQLARQDEETRRIWAARLNTELEALHDFHNTLIKENNQ
jgi:hypothetical protein